jgi:hypothetical protein
MIDLKGCVILGWIGFCGFKTLRVKSMICCVKIPPQKFQLEVWSQTAWKLIISFLSNSVLIRAKILQIGCWNFDDGLLTQQIIDYTLRVWKSQNSTHPNLTNNRFLKIFTWKRKPTIFVENFHSNLCRFRFFDRYVSIQFTFYIKLLLRGI